MPYSDDMIRAVCEEMGIEWNDSSQVPTLNHQPLEQSLNIRELFYVDVVVEKNLYQVTEIKVNNQSEKFDCSMQYLDAA